MNSNVGFREEEKNTQKEYTANFWFNRLVFCKFAKNPDQETGKSKTQLTIFLKNPILAWKLSSSDANNTVKNAKLGSIQFFSCGCKPGLWIGSGLGDQEAGQKGIFG